MEDKINAFVDTLPGVLTMDVTDRLHVHDPEWEHRRSTCVLRYAFEEARFPSMTITYMQGMDYAEPPTLAEVLESLVWDSRNLDLDSRESDDLFREWAEETECAESLTNYRIWQVCRRNATNLRTLIGVPAFTRLLSIEED